MNISNEFLMIIAIFSITSLLFSIITSIISILALSKVIGMEKSTHSVQLMPVDEEIDKHNQKILAQWATKEDSLKKQQKMYKEELEEKLPEFIEEETEIISF